ncbi:MAG: TIGR04282 family arsenosugar biosynthesis glycosyltransferase [Ferruginibacter sp.]
MKSALIIFVRNPELGKVKTRLAATAGDEQALDIYCGLLNHTMLLATEIAADKFVYYYQQIKADDIWNEDRFYKKIQTGENLGDKMKAAFNEIFKLGYKRVIIIGSDCLQLNSTIINAGFALLDEHDTVIGPATDGGYYLLGMKKSHGFLFDNKAWSTESVYDESIKDMQQHHLSTGLLPVLTDVDTEADWIESKKLL